MGLLALTLSNTTFAKAPADNVRLTGILNCNFIDHPTLTAKYSAYKGKGDLTIFEDETVVMKRDIFLLEGSRCSSYGEGCFTGIHAPSRLGDDFKITVQAEGEDYNSPDIYNLSVTDKLITVADTEEYFSRMHLVVGYKNAPAPFDQQNILKMVCTGDLYRP